MHILVWISILLILIMFYVHYINNDHCFGLDGVVRIWIFRVFMSQCHCFEELLFAENMPTWWGKSSSKEAKKKTTKGSLIESFHKKFKSPESKSSSRSGGSRRLSSDIVSERGSQSRAQSRSPSPSKHVARCQSFAERPRAQPLPVPGLSPAQVSRTDSGINVTVKPKSERVYKPSLFLPLPRPACIRQRLEPADLDTELAVASICSECSIESDDPSDSRQRSPLANDYDNGCRTAAGSPTR